MLGAVGDAAEGIVRKIAPLLDEEVLQPARPASAQMRVKSTVPFPTSVVPAGRCMSLTCHITSGRAAA